MNKQILVFSGLGADERVFQHIDWGDNDIIHVSWVEPLKNERIEDYARRLIAPYQTRKPVLVGLSFGGIVAIEVSKHIAFERILLLSSVKHHREIPWYMRIVGRLGLHRLIPPTFLKGAGTVHYWLFGLKTQEEKELLDGFLMQSSIGYLRWAIGCVLTWKNVHIPSPIVHIHGEADRILPLCFIRADNIIKDGGHFMVFDHPQDVNNVIRSYL